MASSQKLGQASVWERVAAVVVGVEAVTAGVWAVGTLMVAYGDAVERPQTVWFMIFFALALAVTLALTGIALWRGRRWARGPAGAWNVLQIGMGFMSMAANPVIGTAFVLSGIVVLGGVVASLKRSLARAQQEPSR